MDEEKKQEPKVKTEPKSKLIDLVDPSNLLHMGMLFDNNLLSKYKEEVKLTLTHNSRKIRKSITESEFNKKLEEYMKKEIWIYGNLYQSCK